METRVILIGVGGASCSGKTSLTKHLENILPNCYLIHQDDYAPSEELIPYHPEHKVRDWDTAATAIEWQRFINDLQEIKNQSKIDESKRSHEHLNLLLPVPIRDEVSRKWKAEFASLSAKSTATTTTKYVLVEGFLMYWHPAVYSLLDVRILLRESRAILQQRRAERNDRIAEDSFWKDPPNTFENIVWPAYEDAHRSLFENGDVQDGKLKPDVDITLLEAREVDMSAMVDESCQKIRDFAQRLED